MPNKKRSWEKRTEQGQPTVVRLDDVMGQFMFGSEAPTTKLPAVQSFMNT